MFTIFMDLPVSGSRTHKFYSRTEEQTNLFSPGFWLRLFGIRRIGL